MTGDTEVTIYFCNYYPFMTGDTEYTVCYCDCFPSMAGTPDSLTEYNSMCYNLHWIFFIHGRSCWSCDGRSPPQCRWWHTWRRSCSTWGQRTSSIIIHCRAWRSMCHRWLTDCVPCLSLLFLSDPHYQGVCCQNFLSFTLVTFLAAWHSSHMQSASQGQICLDNCSYCHIEIEIVDQTAVSHSTPNQPVSALTL